MTQEVAVRPAPEAGRFARPPGWLLALLVFAASRVLDTALLLPRLAQQQEAVDVPAHPGYVDAMALWDGRWYLRAAEQGWPSALPEAHGHVLYSTWAFLPGWPLLLRAGAWLTGLSAAQVSTVLAPALGAVAAVLLHRLAGRLGFDPVTCLGVVALWCFQPASLVLQLPYTESLTAVLLLGGTLALLSGRYPAAALLLGAATLVRPVGPPLLVLVAVHGWRVRRPGGAGVVAAAVVAGTAAWPATAWAVTGRPDAYLRAEAAWQQRLALPFQVWLAERSGPLLLAVLAVAALAAVLCLPVLGRPGWPVRLPTELVAWQWAGVAFLVSVHDGESLVRYALLLLPLYLAPLLARRRLVAWAVLPSWLVGTAVWITVTWPMPPGGGAPP